MNNSMIINNKYKIFENIGAGSFGSIFKGENIRTGEKVAIKVEPISSNLKLLKNESSIYHYLNGLQGIPNVKWFGKDIINYYMVINLLGKSLENLVRERGRFNLRLTLKIGIKMLTLLKSIHDKGLVHRDIKPDNFLFGLDNYQNIYIIDFGFCKRYLKDDVHIPIRKTNSLIGSINYASLHAHNRDELSRRDDLESFYNVLLYLLSGSLPWNNLSNELDIAMYKREQILVHNQPLVLRELIEYIRQMKFEENPNYYLIIRNFTEELDKLS